MMRVLFAAVLLGCLVCGPSAWAHRIDECLQATIIHVTATEVEASMRLVPGTMVAESFLATIDTDRDGTFSQAEQRAYASQVLSKLAIVVDGQATSPRLRSWQYPAPAEIREGLGEIKIDYTVDLPDMGPEHTFALQNHYLNAGSVYLMNVLAPEDPGLIVTAQKRDPLQANYVLIFRRTTGSQDPGRHSPWAAVREWNGLFRLGMRHIAEGTDHLLFLLVLVLPAPLLAAGKRWTKGADLRQSLRRILGIVTAFTVGHSLTLGLAAMGLVHVPEPPVEVLIAISILVSALHALRPLFPGREFWIAGVFGSIHGLAFAATLGRLGLSSWARVTGILAFNLGIETMQILVVCGVFPSLLLLSRTKLYSGLRTLGALFAMLAATGWIADRLFNADLPVDRVVNALTAHAVLFAVSLFVLSMTSLLLRRVPSNPLRL